MDEKIIAYDISSFYSATAFQTAALLNYVNIVSYLMETFPHETRNHLKIFQNAVNVLYQSAISKGYKNVAEFIYKERLNQDTILRETIDFQKAFVTITKEVDIEKFMEALEFDQTWKNLIEKMKKNFEKDGYFEKPKEAIDSMWEYLGITSKKS